MAETLIVASASPRRASLLRSLGLTFTVAPVDVNEGALVRDDDPHGIASVVRIAQAKFSAVIATTAGPPPHALTADTLVACDGHIMGKPQDDDHARAMLERMSGRALSISTALCLGVVGAAPTTTFVTTTVALRTLTRRDIDDYLTTGSAADKAAGLALQAEAGSFIDSVDGCWSNVLGLPVCAVAEALDLAPHGAARLDRCTDELCGSWSTL